ncbi:DNA topoisomerase IV subunit A [Pseudogracilibacillus sp. SE30717A]|uniref:DNA topoisomerase IV subunit A n=1 Tax=Pseudogracilibacillus sp. SE30717A TaxID=3098293 RepID=UPI00300E0F52
MSQMKQYVDLPLEDVIGDRFGRYSKYIIQDRALPDVRDGLKPVQRRILFAMHEDKNTHENNFRKAAKTVGTVIGNYHPHGDTSVYDAMVRLSQDWKMRYELVEMHGNNGSIDGDPPAAMRYTEARLAKITTELLSDIEKNTVDFIPNFDDTNKEPLVFPSKLPNLLINGSTGISAGYATNIPPHNIEEVIDAVILKIDKPNATLDDLMTKIKGPDFPTGGIVQGIDGIKQAFKTGKGRVVVRGKATIEKMRGNREQIVIEEIPFDVNKANLVRKIDELNAEKRVEGIAEVRDETDRTGLRIVIDLKKDADGEGILNFLYKNTELQTVFHYNMVAIQDKTPKLLSLSEILDAYIKHQIDVVTRQTKFDLHKAKDRVHIVDGLIKAISILDELIQTIRESKNKADAKNNIIEKYNFSDSQAEAILSLQLYRLTNTDITLLSQEKEELEEKINIFTEILNNPQVLLNTIKKDLRRIKRTYGDKRITAIEAEIEEIKINIEVTVPSETVLVSVTKEGYIKRTSLRSFAASNKEDLTIKSTDHLVSLIEVDTTDQLLLFTNTGKYICIPVHELPDIRWKDTGIHLSNVTTFDSKETIVQSIPVRNYTKNSFLVFVTKQGMIKKTEQDLYQSTRYSRSLIALNLRKNDEVVNVFETNGNQDIFIATNRGYGLWFSESEISPVGQRALGVIAIQLKDDDYVINGQVINPQEYTDLFVVTQRGACKRMKLSAFEKTSRARRGMMMLRELKAKPHRIIGFFSVGEDDQITLVTDKENKIKVAPYGLPISDRNSNGSFIIDSDVEGNVEYSIREAEHEKPFDV